LIERDGFYSPRSPRASGAVAHDDGVSSRRVPRDVQRGPRGSREGGGSSSSFASFVSAESRAAEDSRVFWDADSSTGSGGVGRTPAVGGGGSVEKERESARGRPQKVVESGQGRGKSSEERRMPSGERDESRRQEGFGLPGGGGGAAAELPRDSVDREGGGQAARQPVRITPPTTLVADRLGYFVEVNVRQTERRVSTRTTPVPAAAVSTSAAAAAAGQAALPPRDTPGVPGQLQGHASRGSLSAAPRAAPPPPPVPIGGAGVGVDGRDGRGLPEPTIQGRSHSRGQEATSVLLQRRSGERLGQESQSASAEEEDRDSVVSRPSSSF